MARLYLNHIENLEQVRGYQLKEAYLDINIQLELGASESDEPELAEEAAIIKAELIRRGLDHERFIPEAKEKAAAQLEGESS